MDEEDLNISSVVEAAAINGIDVKKELFKLTALLEESKRETKVVIHRIDKKLQVQTLEIEKLKVDLDETKNKLSVAEKTIIQLNNTIVELESKFQIWQRFVTDLLPIVQNGKRRFS